MIVMILLDEARTPSVLEMYFARCFGLSLLTIGAITFILTGSIPLSSSYSMTTDESDPKAPYAMPTVLMTSIFHASSAFYTYAWYYTTGQASFALAMTVYGGLAAVGLWCLLFANSAGRISSRTGADKRMSGFPFKNAEADKKGGWKKRL
ncbi:hypothetical protein PABG_03222 [Paracoccidioides brasiliensis Pb03]|uniref:Uncharacterized protein n=2 Tax=Paracoccidioides brasiliensis TaxID=121759 RepID=C1G4B0_PARBD|nr:uncharacterized protein PADG_01776 [Paracoccidioides brasiliensis Pb18]EEH20991.2 hypothetical protein PABG_03222 [Paracoccidioides brasiliensis Pb03]EEH45626.2 hypothetical protein PADG_01776 [Paracoccidioides brasiliensis Pb18]ODH42110.1 hypothetical protein ACO22_01263 [Paracoccidioides brasiliensis]